MLSDLQTVLDDLQKRAFQYKSYQKNFKVTTAVHICFQNAYTKVYLCRIAFNKPEPLSGQLCSGQCAASTPGKPSTQEGWRAGEMADKALDAQV